MTLSVRMLALLLAALTAVLGTAYIQSIAPYARPSQVATVVPGELSGVRGHANLRSGPGLTYDVVGRAEPGSTVFVYRWQDGWAEIYMSDGIRCGWIPAECLDRGPSE